MLTLPHCEFHMQTSTLLVRSALFVCAQDIIPNETELASVMALYYARRNSMKGNELEEDGESRE